MGNLLDELAKIELQKIEDTSKILKALEGPIMPLANEWTVLAGPSDKAEENQKVVDDLNSSEPTPEDWELAMRARDLSELESIFERLGINKKLEELKPDIEKCRQSIIHGGYDCSVDLDSLKRVIEFMECLDEP